MSVRTGGARGRTSGPGASYAAHRDAIDGAIRRVLESGWYITGDEVAAFEREFATYVGVGHGVGTGSGTDALQLALRACGLGPGDAVVTVSHTAVATVAAIELAGAVPVLVDIDPDHFTLDPERLAETVRAADGRGEVRIKAVIPVHLYGQPADMPAIMDVARRYGLYVVEDCAQAHGAELHNRRVGRWGDIAAFSFYPTKNLGAFGDAGALLTDDNALATRARLLREYGWRERYVSEIPGLNSRLDEIQAAVLRVKLPHLDRENGHRREMARRYDDALASGLVMPPAVRPGGTHVYHQYVVRSRRRDAVRAWLADREVPTQVHYPLPIHLQPAYRRRVAIGAGGLANTERVCREILSLPIGAHLLPADVEAVAAILETAPIDREP
jgi:dTDP-4-amino-4,6-dideoxygalactose transaminase